MSKPGDLASLQLLNRQLSGVNRRTTKISLNSPSPSSPLSTAEPVASTSTLPSSTSASSSFNPNDSTTTLETDQALHSSVASLISSADPQSQSSSSPNTNGSKRKLRSSKDSTSTTPKRSRAAGGSLLDTNHSAVADKYAPPTTRLSDLGGVDSCIESMLELVALPLCHPEVYLWTGVRPPRGVLLVGPPGCGKTMLAGAIAGELGCPFISISAPSIVSGMSGESEKTLRETFEEAARLAPCILFIDEIDAITPKRETAQREMERRIVAQLLTCMDDLSWDKTDNKPVMIIGATNRPDSLDPALRRAGRFDAEITMGVPDQAGRERILRVLMAKLRLSGDFDYTFLAKSTPGYVGADLSALTGAAGVIAVKRIFDNLGSIIGEETTPVGATITAIPDEIVIEGGIEGREEESMMVDEEELVTISNFNSTSNSSATATPALISNSTSNLPPQETPLLINSEFLSGLIPFRDLPPSLASLPIASFLQSHPNALTSTQLQHLSLTNADFSSALSIVQPSSQREGFTTVPDVTWADLGALKAIREEMRMSIVRPIRRPEIFQALGIMAPCGVLLWGPPGCGKTLLAKAVANESGANFISVKGPELLNKYVGESERAVRQVFARARASSPCIIFFDELDAMVPRRDDSLSESSARVVNTLLTELDGLEPRKQVFVIGATNRPDILDPAMVRPGRLDKLLYVDLPNSQERYEILLAQTKKTPLGNDVDLNFIAKAVKCEGFSGADLSALVREAAVSALRELFDRMESAEEKEGAEEGDGMAGGLEPSGLESAKEKVKLPMEGVVVEMKHFLTALKKTSPSVSIAQRKRFEVLRAKFAGQPIGRNKEGRNNREDGTGAGVGEGSSERREEDVALT